MTIGRLLLACTVVLVLWLQAVLAALLWPTGGVLPPIDGVDAWLAGFVTIGAGLLLVAVHRQIAKPLIDCCQALLLAARGMPSATAAPHFGRTDEVGDIAVALATLQAEQAQRLRLRDELAALQAEAERRLGELGALERMVEHMLDALPMPVSVCDLNGRIAFVNREWEACFRVPRTAVLGMQAVDEGAERQRDVEVHGRHFHRSHAVIQNSRGEPSAVVTTFSPAPPGRKRRGGR